jgi:hypothetical protein
MNLWIDWRACAVRHVERAVRSLGMVSFTDISMSGGLTAFGRGVFVAVRNEADVVEPGACGPGIACSATVSERGRHGPFSKAF